MTRNANKTKVAALRMTEEDRLRIERISHLENMSPSAWMRKCIMDKLDHMESFCRRIEEEIKNDR